MDNNRRRDKKNCSVGMDRKDWEDPLGGKKNSEKKKEGRTEPIE